MTMKEELGMTRTTVIKLLSDKNNLSKLNKEMRCQIISLKKQVLNTNTIFVVQKAKYKTRISDLKKEIHHLKTLLNNFMMDDDDFVVDPKTGVIDVTQDQEPPMTPEKPKRSFVC